MLWYDALRAQDILATCAVEHAALRNLYELEAISLGRDTLQVALTPLGCHLAHLPMDARSA
eukprot:14716-Heterococcus_DN1.PRE.2